MTRSDPVTNINFFGGRYYGCLPVDIEGFESLVELALDMRWSWNHVADELWHQLDPVLWKLTRNPWLILQTVARERLESFFKNGVFRGQVEDLDLK